MVRENIAAPLHLLLIDFPDLEHELGLLRVPDPVQGFPSLLLVRLYLQVWISARP